MPLSIECPNCTTRFRVGDHLAGKRVKCRKCATGIHVPDAPNLDKAKELPLRKAEAESLVYRDPVIRFEKPKLPHGPLADAVIRAEAFVAADAIGAEPIFSPGVGTLVNEPPAPLFPRMIAGNHQAPIPEYSSNRRSIRPCTAGPEGFSPLLLLVYVILEIVSAIYLSSQPAAISSTIWTVAISEIVTFFAVVGPSTWLGMWGASKAMRFELATPTYIKICAVAVVPGMLLGLTRVLPDNPVLFVFTVIAILPATFFLMMLSFDLMWIEALMTFLLGSVGWMFGRVIQLVLIGAIIIGANMKSPPNAGPALSGPIASNSSIDTGVMVPTDTPPSVPLTTPADPVITEVDRLSLQAHAMLRANWTSDISRERMTDQFNSLKNHLDMLRSLAKDDDRKAALAAVTPVMTDLQNKIAKLPSESPDPMIYQPILAARPTWVVGPDPAAVAVSFQQYRLQVPHEAQIDLASTEEAPDGLSWDIQPHGTLNICSLPRKDLHQLRPWVRTQSFMKADVPDVFAIDMVNTPVEITYGLLGQLPATRIASTGATDGPGKFARDRFVKFVVADGPSWVIATASNEANDARALTALEHSLWSVRRARTDEPRLDPFTPEAMVSRLRDDRARAILLRMGVAAEPALLARVNDSDPVLRVRVIELLGQVGTSKSLPPLLLLCTDQNTTFVEAARAAVRNISPADMDDTAIGLMNAQSRNFQIRKRGVTELAAITPKADDPRKSKVAAVLTEMVQDGQLSFGVPDESLADALLVWQTPGTVSSLLPMLDQKGDFLRRKTAMVVLSRMKDKRAAWPIARWLVEDTQDAQAALITMGSIAEDDVLKVFDQKTATPRARVAACNVLAEIGTARSLKALGCVVTDHKNPGDADAANAAIAQIRDRVGSKPADASSHAPSDDKAAKNGLWVPPGSK